MSQGLMAYTARMGINITYIINTLRLRWNGRHFPDDIFKYIFLNENIWISIKISLKYLPILPILQHWFRKWLGADQATSHYEPMMDSLLTHICITRPQWIKPCLLKKYKYRYAFCNIHPCWNGSGSLNQWGTLVQNIMMFGNISSKTYGNEQLS